MALAHLPTQHDLDSFDFNHSSGISKQEMKELRQLSWLDQAYNLILMGPSGTNQDIHSRRAYLRGRKKWKESIYAYDRRTHYHH